jgi:hypothetical protein
MLLLASGCNEAAPITLDAPTHFKSGGRGRLGDVTVTVQMVPKRIVEGNEPEIEQVQIDVLRGTDHAVMRVDTRNDRAAWGGYAFVLGDVNVGRDDIVLTVHMR